MQSEQPLPQYRPQEQDSSNQQEGSPSSSTSPDLSQILNKDEKRLTRQEWAFIINQAYLLKECQDEKEQASRLERITQEFSKQKYPQVLETQITEEETIPISRAYQSSENLGVSRKYIDIALDSFYPSKEKVDEIIEKYSIRDIRESNKKYEEERQKPLLNLIEARAHYRRVFKELFSTLPIEIIEKRVKLKNGAHYHANLKIVITEEKDKKFLKFFKIRRKTKNKLLELELNTAIMPLLDLYFNKDYKNLFMLLEPILKKDENLRKRVYLV